MSTSQPFTRELRTMKTSPLLSWTTTALLTLLLGTATSGWSATVGYWRLENNALDSSSNLLGGTASGGVFSTLDTPGPTIFDPVAGTFTANTHAYNASGSGAKTIVVPDNALFSQENFTWEMFIKVTGQPASYDAFLTNRDSVSGLGRGYQIDFDGNPAVGSTAFGRLRARFDLPIVVPVTDPPTPNPNQNQVATVTTGYLYQDADGGGAGGIRVNSDTSWHHIALTKEGNQVRVYLDGVASSARTLTGPFEEALASIIFGKTSSADYGLLIDEVRFSDTVLLPSQFLQAVPEPSRAMLLFLCAGAIVLRRRRN